MADIAVGVTVRHNRPPRCKVPVAIELESVGRDFDGKAALREVDLRVDVGQIHALLGPNGAGKTTLLRVLCGLTDPSRGRAHILGLPSTALSHPGNRGLVGLMPSGDRTAYLRISGFENLVFFARMHGLRKSDAKRRATDLLAAVGLQDSARQPVGMYSHGMQKRLSIARALLMSPPVLLIDEATHDLDPAGARTIRDLVKERAEHGTAVLWATQRLDEIRTFADAVSVLDHGRLCFTGTVEDLIALRSEHTYMLHLRGDSRYHSDESLIDNAQLVLGAAGSLHAVSRSNGVRCLLGLHDGAVLGREIARLADAGIEVLNCTQHGSGVEAAFLFLTEAQRS